MFEELEQIINDFYNKAQTIIERQKEIDKIHQKQNGELQTKLSELENENHIPRID